MTVLDLSNYSSTDTNYSYSFDWLFSNYCSLEFFYSLYGVGCWPICLYWSSQHPLILKLVLECSLNVSVGHIKTIHTAFLLPQVCVRLWRGCWVFFQTCSLQLIALLDMKYPSSSFSRLLLLIVDLCVSYLLDQRSLILKLFLSCYYKLSVGRIQTGHTYLHPPQVWVRSWQECWFLWFHLSSSIHFWIQGSSSSLENLWWILGNWFINIKEYCSFCWRSGCALDQGAPRPIGLIPGNVLVDCWRFIYKHQIILFLLLSLKKSVGQRGAKYHWVSLWKCFGGLLTVYFKKSQKIVSFVGDIDKIWLKKNQGPLD